MDARRDTPNHRKRKRRRIPDRPAVAAHLIIDDTASPNAVTIPDDIFDDLFGSLRQLGEPASSGQEGQNFFVAVTPQVPGTATSPSNLTWTVFPVARTSKSKHGKEQVKSCLRISPSSVFLNHFLEHLCTLFPEKAATTSREPIDVHILDIVPVSLDTVVVSVWDDPESHAEGKPVTEAIRASLGTSGLVQTSTLFEMADSGSHSPRRLTKARIDFCEPVSQGLLSPETKIVVVPKSRDRNGTARPHLESLPTWTNGVSDGEDEDTSNERFYSAAEEYSNSPLPAKRKAKAERNPRSELDANDSDQEQSVDMSESDSETIGLSLPNVPNGTWDKLSNASTATPGGHLRYNDGVSSPGSVMSGLSGSTIRAGPKAKTFRTAGLAKSVPDEWIYPVPAASDDDDARLFVDSVSLAKLGCFSGDWVKIQADEEISLDTNSSWGPGPGQFNGMDNDNTDLRVAKIYGLPQLAPYHGPRPTAKATGRRSKALGVPDQSTMRAVYMSPILLANIGNLRTVRICALMERPKAGSRSRQNHMSASISVTPPLAKEVDIYKLATPVATERNLQSSLFRGLRKYFESRNRIVKTGDLIAIPIDSDIGKALYSGAGAEEEADSEELNFSSSTNDSNGGQSKTEVTWFKIGPVAVENTKQGVNDDASNLWGGMAMIKQPSTRMSQKGSATGKIPSTADSCWPYYLGVKQVSTVNINEVVGFTIPPIPFISSTRRRVKELASAATSPQAVHFRLPPVAILITSTQRRIGKATTAINACADLGLHVFTIDAYDILSEGGSAGGDVNTAGLLEARAERAMTCGPEYTVLLIKHIDVLTAERMAATLRTVIDNARVVVGTTSNVDKVHESIRSHFTHELEMSAPDEGEREGILRDVIQDSGIELSPDVDLGSVAVKTAALVASDLADVVERAVVARQQRLEQLTASANAKAPTRQVGVITRDLLLAGGLASRCVIKADFDVAVDAGRKNFADAIGAPKIPNVGWDDVGGLANVKDAVMETIQLPLERPELFAKGMKKRSGILFYGPPGTGKTLLAKAIATEFSLNFFSVKGPELLNMYIGESEANVRRVFQRARDARPCVVFFDELDSVAPKRGNQGDSGGVMDRIVSQLLAELDGMSSGDEGGGGVFVIGATNRPDLLDQALLRPGRFDKMLYLSVSDTHDKQFAILEALTRKFTLHPSLSLRDVASTLPFTYTGADFYALCSDAMLKAITRRASSVDEKVRDINAHRAAADPPQNPITVAYFFDHYAETEDSQVVVEEEDFHQAIRELVPSVSAKELEHYDAVRRTFEKGEEKKDAARRRSSAGGRRNVNFRPHSGSSHRQNGGHDDLILRTGRMSLDDSAMDGHDGLHASTNGVSSKGKGKMKVTLDQIEDVSGFGDAAAGDDALYEE